MAAHNELGKWGEDCAADYLQRKGYTIVERDWKSGHRDIDIIAFDENRTVVFVEVKTRRNRIFGEPEESVDYRKLRNLKAAINHYVKYRCIDNDIRFDIITVVGTIGAEPEIDHLMDVPL
jgi:putative endonuclease